MKHYSFGEYLEATRYWSFVVSAMPVVVTFAYLCSNALLKVDAGVVLNFLLCLLGVVIFHAAGNLLSDYFDFRTNVDNEESFSTPCLVHHKFEAKEFLRESIILFTLGIAIGIVLVLRSGLLLLGIGAVSAALTALYSFFKYRALGDIDVFLIFSILIMSGTSYTLSGQIFPELLLLAVPVGVITVSVLHANNTVDIATDSASGITTFAIVIGGKASGILYMGYMVIPFVCVAAYVIAGILHPLALFSFAAVPLAYRNFKAAGGFPEKGTAALQGLDKASSQLQLIFSGLLSIGLFIASAL